MENDIRELRRPIRELNRRFLDRIVEGMSLRDNLTPAVVMRYIECIDSTVRKRFSPPCCANTRQGGRRRTCTACWPPQGRSWIWYCSG